MTSHGSLSSTTRICSSEGQGSSEVQDGIATATTYLTNCVSTPASQSDSCWSGAESCCWTSKRQRPSCRVSDGQEAGWLFLLAMTDDVDDVTAGVAQGRCGFELGRSLLFSPLMYKPTPGAQYSLPFHTRSLLTTVVSMFFAPTGNTFGQQYSVLAIRRPR